MKQSSIEFQSFTPVSEDILIFPEREMLITGKITCLEESFPLENVHISIKGKGIGSCTKKDGSWNLRLPCEECVFEFSLPGFENQEVAVSRSGHLEIVLRRISNPMTSLFYSTVLEHQIHP